MDGADPTRPDGEASAGALGGSADTPPREQAPEPPLRDPKPRKRPGRPKLSAAQREASRANGAKGAEASRRKTRTKELEGELARALVLPVVPTIMAPIAEPTKAFLAQHFMEAGPPTAKRLAELSEASPQLREILERMTQGSVTLGLVMVGAGYVGPVVLAVIGMLAQAEALSTAARLDAEQLQELSQVMAVPVPSQGNGAAGPPSPETAEGAQAGAGAPAL